MPLSQRKVLPFRGFIPRLLMRQGIPVNPCPAGKIRGKGQKLVAIPVSPGPEHARGQLRAEPVTARQPQIPVYCLLINLLIMFCFNPRAWRQCGNVRHLFMPRVAGRVTKASVPQVPPRVTWSCRLRATASCHCRLPQPWGCPCASVSPIGAGNTWNTLLAPVTVSMPAVISTVGLSLGLSMSLSSLPWLCA